MKKIITSLFIMFSCMQIIQAQTGSIYGKITDYYTGDVLPGASIRLKGTTQGSVTGIDGRYNIRNVDTGTIILEIFYLGYESVEKEVEVVANETMVMDVALMPEISTLGEVVVTGNLEGQEKALNQQRTADNIKNIVSLDQMSRFPDLNVAEALQRVPGINITRDRGEGSTISIRGTPAHFTSININGEQLPSTQDNGSRNESLDLIPADQLASMEIVKAITPDMDGDAIGGSVNLRTPTARGMQWKLRAETGAGYNSLSRGYNGIGRFKADRRFFENPSTGRGRLGVLAGFSYFETDNEEDQLEAVWSSFGDTPVLSLNSDTVVIENHEITDLSNQRQRIGATLTLDYQFNPNSEVIFNFMYSRRGDADQRNRLSVFMNESAAVEWTSLDTIKRAELRRDISIRDYFSDNFSYNLEGKHALGSTLFTWGAYYADSRRLEEASGGRFERGEQSRIDLVAANPGGIYSDFLNLQTINSPYHFYDPFVITDVDRYDEVDLNLHSDNLVGKMNFEIPINISDNSGIIKTGVKYRRQSNQRQRINDIYNFSDPNRVFDQREGFASIINPFEDGNFLNGNMRFGSGIDPDLFTQFIDDNDNLYVHDTIRSNRNTFNDTYDATESILAGYAMSRLQVSNFMFLAGVRYERNEVNYDAYRVNNVTGAYTPISDGTSYDFILPNVHIRYSINDLTNIRAAATWSYARANFSDIVPYLQIDEEGSNIRAGNPELKPASAANLDLMFERYLGTVGIISGGLFYKNIDDFQFTRNLRFTRPGDPYYEEFPGFQFRQEQNGENAQVYGFEFNTQSALKFLPGFLQGFSVYFNYTYTASEAFTSDRTDIQLPGQAEHTWNGSLSYNSSRFTIRTSVNYNGSFLQTVAGEARNDLIQEARTQFDINANFNITDQIRIFADFMNVTNAPAIVYQGRRERIAEYAFYGWWNRFGITYSL